MTGLPFLRAALFLVAAPLLAATAPLDYRQAPAAVWPAPRDVLLTTKAHAAIAAAAGFDIDSDAINEHDYKPINKNRDAPTGASLAISQRKPTVANDDEG